MEADYDKSKWRVFSDAEEGLSIIYPSTWNRTEGQMNTTVAFIHPEETAASINLLTQDLGEDEPMTTTDFAERSVEEFRRAGLVVDERPSRLFGKPGACFEFIAPMGPKDMKIVQHFTVHRSKVYILTYTAPSDISDKFSDIVNEMVKSTKFVAPVPSEKRPMRDFFTQPVEVPSHQYRAWLPLWTLAQTSTTVTCSFTCQKINPSDNNAYTLKIIISVTPLPASITSLDQWSELTVNHIQEENDDGSSSVEIQPTNIQLGGQDARLISYNSDSIIPKGRVQQAWTIKDNKVYNITTVSDTPADDTRVGPLFERIRSLFEFYDTKKSMAHLYGYDYLTYRFGVKYSRDFAPQPGKTTATFERKNSRVVFAVHEMGPATRSLNDFEKELQPLLSMSEDGKILKNEDVDIRGVPAKRIAYSARIQGETVQSEQMCAFHNGFSYVVVFTAPKRFFDDERRYAEVILTSFQMW
eukprot:TRINITY_DN1403_c0_g1_i2.p1 TRINITY_DN1403_c0_g1~~TRINITY_DN1403_c0_g1_i2.p1  ORF type:complete len:469 (-),score=92.25 TRINITY_DN1403_c0_g1_i2:211-1617(-)